MRPKGKLFALLSVFAAIAIITASGAFTTVTAQRTATVSTAGDASALLAMEPHAASANGQDAYASTDGDGVLTIDLAASGQGAGGVNQDALTEVDHVFNITNQGTQTVYVWITKTGANSGVVQFYSGQATTGTNVTTSANNVSVDPGTTVQVSMTIDTRNADLGQDAEILTDITIHANATQPS